MLKRVSGEGPSGSILYEYVPGKHAAPIEECIEDLNIGDSVIGYGRVTFCRKCHVRFLGEDRVCVECHRKEWFKKHRGRKRKRVRYPVKGPNGNIVGGNNGISG